jgi:type I restriction enzyme S subunit
VKCWPTKPLGEVCEFRHGNTPSKAEMTNWGGSFPWVSPKDMRGEIITDTEDHLTPETIAAGRAAIAKNNSLLVVVRSGILAHTFPVAIAGRDVAFNQDLKSIRVVSHALTPRYLLRFLQASSPQILRHGTKRGPTVQSIRSGFLESLPTPVPPLTEQERIVKLLDEADELRKLRARADRRTADLIPALFHDMFGDPATNYKGWPVTSASEIFAKIGYGVGTPPPFTETGLIFLRGMNIKPTGIILDSVAYFSSQHAESMSRSIVNEGDVVIVRRGANTGDAARIPPSLDGAYAGYDLILRPKRNKMLADWFVALFNFSSMSRYVRQIRERAAQQGLNAAQIGSLQIPLPPLMLQTGFADRVAEIRKLEDRQAISRERFDALFQSMLHRAFCGEL